MRMVEGRLPVWGKDCRDPETWKVIPPSFWNDHEIDYLSVSNNNPDSLVIRSISTEAKGKSTWDVFGTLAHAWPPCQF